MTKLVFVQDNIEHLKSAKFFLCEQKKVKENGIIIILKTQHIRKKKKRTDLNE